MSEVQARRNEIELALQPLFDALPLDQAMASLVPSGPLSGKVLELAEAALAGVADPAVRAAVWLYVDDLDRSHTVSQSMPDATGAIWHGIMHRREGDFGNAKYWFRQAGSHPVMAAIEGYDPYGFVDRVAENYRENPADLVEIQRQEWLGLFNWGLGRA